MADTATGVHRPRFRWQAAITVAVLLGVGFLVLLPMVFLVEESLNVGDPMAFPPVEFGIASRLAAGVQHINIDIRVLNRGSEVGIAHPAPLVP